MEDSHIAYLRFRKRSDNLQPYLVLCNSNDEGAFKVYRHTTEEDLRIAREELASLKVTLNATHSGDDCEMDIQDAITLIAKERNAACEQRDEAIAVLRGLRRAATAYYFRKSRTALHTKFAAEDACDAVLAKAGVKP